MQQSIGNMLKDAREKKGFSLEDVHSKIKIHPKVIQLLEEDHFDKLPSPLFVKSFLRAYAEFLEVDADHLVDTYEKEKRVDPDQVLYIKPAQEKQFTPNWNRTLFVTLTWVFSLVLLISAVLFIFSNINNSIKDKKKVAALQAMAAKNKNAAAKTSAKQIAAAATSPRQAAEPVSKAARASNSVGTEWLRSPEQENFPKLSKKLPLRLTIEALDNVWIRVTCDGKVLFQAVLKRGTSESWSATQNIEIWTGNSSNMALTLNGTSIGSPGKGVIKKMLVSHDGVKIGS